jgi:hypothetical protein
VIWLLLLQDSIGWRSDYDEALKVARERHSLLLVHFWKPQDADSTRLDADTFTNPEVIALSGKYVCVRLNGMMDNRFSSAALPATLLVEDGKVLRELPGYVDPRRFASVLRAYLETYPKLKEARDDRERFDIYFVLEDWGRAVETLEKIGPAADPSWFYRRKIDLALQRASRDPKKLQGLRSIADEARKVQGLEEDAAALDAVLLLSDKKFDEAIALASRPHTVRRDVFFMVIAAAYLQQGKKEQARPVLEELSKMPTDYGRWAAGLLKP